MRPVQHSAVDVSDPPVQHSAVDVSDPQVDGNSLRRHMSLRHLVGNGLVFIGPAAAVAIYGVVAADSGGAVATVYIVATLVMALTALSYTQMSHAVPRAGSIFSYATAGIGPGTGFIAGWMVLLDYMLIPSVAFVFTGLALHSFITSVPTWAFTAVAAVVATGINLSGVRNLARAAIVVVLAETIVLAAVVVGTVVVIATSGTTRPPLSPLTGVGAFSLTAVIGAVSVAALSYLGFDAIATFAEETVGSSKLVGRATIVCLIAAGFLFLVQTYVVALITPLTPHELAANPELQGDAYYDIVRGQVAPWLATALGLVKAIGAIFSGMVGQAAGSRVMMTMARDRRMPRFLAAVSPRAGLPVKSIVCVTAVTLLLATGAAILPAGLSLLSSTVSIGALSAFVLLHISVIGYYVLRKRSQNYLIHLIVPVLGVACLAPIIALASELALIIAAAWLAVGLVTVIIQRRVLKSSPAPTGENHG